MTLPSPRLPLLVAAALGAVTAARAESLTVVMRPVEDLKAVFATVESVHQTQARARIGGTVTELRVREGDQVRAGQVMAVVRDAKLPLQMAAIDARLRSAAAQEHQAETELARATQLRASGTGTQQRQDDARTGLDVIQAQGAAVRAERAVLEQQLREGEVVAPAAGRVLRVPERHARHLHSGDPVLVGARGLAPGAAPETMGRGTVRLVYPELRDGQVMADAEVAGLGDFFVGERVRVYVATGTRPAVVVPPDWLGRRFGVDFVRLADGGERVVQSGALLPALAGEAGGLEVLSGLHGGEVLIRPEGGR
jgi:biotin carboxyl carrier protein